MISEAKWRQYGVPGSKIKGIVIHNTNNQQKSAKWLANWLENGNQGSNGCHFLIDHEEIIQVMPLEWSVFSVGNGMSFGNLDCIAIEICSNPCTKLYLQGQEKALVLIKDLMRKYQLKKSDVFFHRDFQPNINCPAQILNLYRNKSEFLNLLGGEYD